MSSPSIQYSSIDTSVQKPANTGAVAAYWVLVAIIFGSFITAMINWNNYSKPEGTESQRSWAIGASVILALAFLATLFVKPCNVMDGTISSLKTIPQMGRAGTVSSF